MAKQSTQHTPGPWKDGPVFNKDGRAIFYTDDSKPGKWQRRVDGGHCGTFEAADARLIAAAPELLAALQKVWDEGVIPDGFALLQDQVCDAIAKATGDAA